MCSGIETDCFFFFFFIRGLGWPTFFSLPQSEASDELLFLLYLNQRPRMNYFFYFTSIRGLGRATFFTLPQSEASDELLFFTLPQSEGSDERFFSQSKDCPTQDNHCGAIRINSKYNQIYKKMLCLPSRIVGK